MRAPTDMLGMTINRLSVIAYAGSVKGKAKWTCVCDCGRLTTATGNQIRSGRTRSCGCLHREARPRLTHGRTRSPEYVTWAMMRARCLNPNHADFKNYGGRGIVCDPRWRSFENFLIDMGERPEGHTLERIDCNGNYERSNCKWIPAKEQARNRRTCKYAWLNGERMLHVDVAKRLDLSTSRISQWATGRKKIPAKFDLWFECNPATWPKKQ